jgi:hypothetical protein
MQRLLRQSTHQNQEDKEAVGMGRSLCKEASLSFPVFLVVLIARLTHHMIIALAHMKK